jgi:predicted dehydrogenase
VRFPAYPEFEDNCSIYLEMEQGVTGFISSSWLTPDAEPSHGRGATYIYGSRGQVEIIAPGIAHGLEAERAQEAILCTDSKPPHPLAMPEGNLLTPEEDFVYSIVEDRPLHITTDFLLQSVRVALLAQRSAQERRRIEVA